MIRTAFVTAAVLASGLLAPADAQGYNPYRGFYPNPYYTGRSGQFGAPAAQCQKLCSADFSPCDPPEFKRADGRCTNPFPRM